HGHDLPRRERLHRMGQVRRRVSPALVLAARARTPGRAQRRTAVTGRRSASGARRGKVELCIGGLTLELQSEDPDLALGLEGPLRDFAIEGGGQPDTLVRASFGSLEAAPRGELLFDSGSLWQLYRDEDGFRFRSGGLGEAPYKEARFAPDFASGQ